jgi:hypothetical protein
VIFRPVREGLRPKEEYEKEFNEHGLDRIEVRRDN